MCSCQRREDRFYEPDRDNVVARLSESNTNLRVSLVAMSLGWLGMVLYAIGVQSYVAAVPFAVICCAGLFIAIKEERGD